MRWLQQNTVLLGDPSNDGFDSSASMAFGEDYSLKKRIAVAWAKTFPASGYDHNVQTYHGSHEQYKNAGPRQLGSIDSPHQAYQKFISYFSIKQIFTNPCVSFFGVEGLSGGWRVFYPFKILFKSAQNIVRLVTEFPLYVAESAFRHMYIQSRLLVQRINKGEASKWWRFIAWPGMILGALGYYTFKAARLTVRLVTAPVESAKSAWSIHPALGVASGILSVAAYVVLVVFALPLAAVALIKVGAPAVASVITTVVSKIAGLFSSALPVLTGVASATLMAIKGGYNKVRNYLFGRPKKTTQQHHKTSPVMVPTGRNDSQSEGKEPIKRFAPAPAFVFEIDSSGGGEKAPQSIEEAHQVVEHEPRRGAPAFVFKIDSSGGGENASQSIEEAHQVVEHEPRRGAPAFDLNIAIKTAAIINGGERKRHSPVPNDQLSRSVARQTSGLMSQPPPPMTLKEAMDAGNPDAIARALGLNPNSEGFKRTYDVKSSLKGGDRYKVNGCL